MVGVDQYLNGINTHRVNQNWLDVQFEQNTQPHVFVFGHEPAIKVNHTDCLDDNPGSRNAFCNSIVHAGGRVYFCGHDHLYDNFRIDDGDGNINNDLHQVLTIGGGNLRTSVDYDGANSYWGLASKPNDSEYGYVLVEVDGLDVSLSWKHRTEPNRYDVVDVFSYSASDGLSDTDNDGDVDGVDLAGFAWRWKETGCQEVGKWCGRMDMDQSGEIDLYDLSIVSRNWFTYAADISRIAALEVYQEVGNIVIGFSNAWGDAGDWIGLYAQGANNDNWTTWRFTDGTTTFGEVDLLGGSVSFSSGEVPAGDYEARLFRRYSLLAEDLMAVTLFSVE